MNEFFKKNYLIVLAFLFPIILISIIVVPSLPIFSVSTKYNFLYSICVNSQGYQEAARCSWFFRNLYKVENGKLSLDNLVDTDSDGVKDINENYKSRIYFHDTRLNESREINLEEAKELLINDNEWSPDGVRISEIDDYTPDIFPFGGYSRHGFYLIKDEGTRKKMNVLLIHDLYYSNKNFVFIGWVLPGRN